jgi:predicted acetyltransferase
LYREVACLRNGYLDRGPYVWNRVHQPRQEMARAFGVAGPGGLCGYVFLRAGSSHVPFELLLSDFVSTGVEAFQSLLAFFADHRTTADRAIWHGSPVDARLLGVPELVIQSAVDDYWMLRLVDVRAALLGRGYPPVDATLAFQVEDELLPDNSGRHCLSVRAGVPEVEGHGAAPSVRLGVGALAALYSGFASPWELRIAGKLEADDAVLAMLGLLFAGPAPGMSDYF